MLKKKLEGLQGQGHTIKNVGTHGKPLEIFMWNVQTLALIVQKFLARLKSFKKVGQASRS